MIYKSFFKKKTTKIYIILFIIFSLTFSFLTISRIILIKKGNEAYQYSFLYFQSNENIDLSAEENVKKYNQALYAYCQNALTDVYIVKDEPIKNKSNDSGLLKCNIKNIEFEYSYLNKINIIKNEQLYELLNDQNEYYYFINLDNWFEAGKTSKALSSKYNVEINEEEVKIDDNDYRNSLFIFELFIKILLILFAILSLISIINIVADEHKNNKLYYSLGFSKLRIIRTTINKIILVILFPIIIVCLSIIINYLIF